MPFDDPDDDNYKTFRNIKQGECMFLLTHWEQTSHLAKDLIAKSLEVDPIERLTANDALGHGWMLHVGIDYVLQTLGNQLTSDGQVKALTLGPLHETTSAFLDRQAKIALHQYLPPRHRNGKGAAATVLRFCWENRTGLPATASTDVSPTCGVSASLSTICFLESFPLKPSTLVLWRAALVSRSFDKSGMINSRLP